MESLQTRCLSAARRGLDYLVRNQITDKGSADCGRLPFIVDCPEKRITSYTTNWITGICVEALLSGYKAFNDERYLNSAALAVDYLRSLQTFTPWQPETFGLIREETPQFVWAHPRDALSAAWGMLDYSTVTGDEDAFKRAVAYADWYIAHGLLEGYPAWTARLDGKEWEPKWYGSFHSGGAFFFGRLFELTGNEAYRAMMEQMLDFYNTNLLNPDGTITVIRQHGTMEDLDCSADPAWAPYGWIMMHKYNDDFGALANLLAWRITNEQKYRTSALSFLNKMTQEQRADGGFGPVDWAESVPSAAGAIMQEMALAEQLGAVSSGTFNSELTRAGEYLLEHQYNVTDHPFDGAFHGMSGEYTVDRKFCNTRAGAYAILALLRMGGAKDDFYFSGK